jgi:hypothetical protein
MELTRNASSNGNTIASYRDTFRLLLKFAQAKLRNPPSALTIDDLDAPFVSAFLCRPGDGEVPASGPAFCVRQPFDPFSVSNVGGDNLRRPHSTDTFDTKTSRSCLTAGSRSRLACAFPNQSIDTDSIHLVLGLK